MSLSLLDLHVGRSALVRIHAARAVPLQWRRSHRQHCRRTYATEARLDAVTRLAPDAQTGSSVQKPARYGQPSADSHPHLLKEGELTPGIPAYEYGERRRKLMDSLPDGSAVLAVSAPIRYMSEKIFYKYRQSSDFWYLTGVEEPDCALLLEKTPSSRTGHYSTLFLRPPSALRTQWDGASTPPSHAPSFFSVDASYPINDLPTHLSSVLPSYSTLYTDIPDGKSAGAGKKKSLWRALVGRGREDLFDVLSGAAAKRRTLRDEVAKMRVVKSPAEAAVMRRAADLSGNAHAKTMRLTHQGLSERDLEAHFEYLCARGGAARPAYVPVVASGANALTIHYTANNQILEDGEVVLMDAGCELHGYASDITRTFPVSGTFSPPQAQLYAALLTAQKTLVRMCNERENVSLAELHRRSVDLVRAEVNNIPGISLGHGDLERVLYPHYVGHHVGIDLHEGSGAHRGGVLKEGMVITIEPGIYVPPSPAFPRHFHNIGIRIEDDVLVGKEEPTVLSVNAPKEIADVEGACQGSLGLEPY